MPHPLPILAALLLCAAIAAGEMPEPERSVEGRLSSAYGEANVLARPKAGRIHDRVTVLINESTSAKHEVNVDNKRDVSNKWSLSKWFTLDVDKGGNLVAVPRMRTDTADPDRLTFAPNLAYSTGSELKSDGMTESKQVFKSHLSGEVLDILPNGHLVVEARSVVTINDEERTVTLTGRVDPKDLDADSTVDANKMIDKMIRLTGKGDLSRNAKRGWGTRILEALNPF